MTDFSQQTDKILRVNNLRLAYGDYEVLKGVSFHALRGSVLLLWEEVVAVKALLKPMVGLLELWMERLLWILKMFGHWMLMSKRLLLESLEFFFKEVPCRSMNLLRMSLCLKFTPDLNPSEIEGLARYKLNLVKLSGYSEFYPAQLSGGMKKRAG